MKFTVKHFIDDSTHSLKIWEKDLKSINDGTFKYDGSIPESCVDALCKHKVEVYKKVIEYLNTLPKDKVIQSNGGLTEEGVEYYRLVNK